MECVANTKSAQFEELDKYLRTGTYQENKTENEKRSLRRAAKKFVVDGENLFYAASHGSRRLVLRTEGDVQRILKQYHDNSAHQGINRTTTKICSDYYWPTMTTDIRDWIKRCSKCQKNTSLGIMPPSLQPIETKDRWELLGMDLVSLPQTASGNKFLFTATDLFTKFIFLRAIPDKSAASVSKVILELFHIHGPPSRIITDQGREFVNAVNSELFTSFGVRHSITSAYHPQCNGQAERTNQTVKQALAKCVNDQQNDWDQYLDATAYGINISQQRSTGETPFFLMYLRHPKSVDTVDRYIADPASTATASRQDSGELEPTVSAVAIAELINKCNQVEESVRRKMKSAQEKQSAEYNARKRKGKSFTTISVGDRVLKKNARKHTRQGGRLQPEYSGPYTVEAISPSGQVTLRNEVGDQLATRYNVALLKPYIVRTEDNAAANSSGIQQEVSEISSEQVQIEHETVNDTSLEDGASLEADYNEEIWQRYEQ